MSHSVEGYICCCVRRWDHGHGGAPNSTAGVVVRNGDPPLVYSGGRIGPFEPQHTEEQQGIQHSPPIVGLTSAQRAGSGTSHLASFELQVQSPPRFSPLFGVQA